MYKQEQPQILPRLVDSELIYTRVTREMHSLLFLERLAAHAKQQATAHIAALIWQLNRQISLQITTVQLWIFCSE